jgi:hypothetical protein
MKNQKGFSLLIIPVVIMVLSLSGGAAYHVWQKNKESSASYNPCPKGQFYAIPPLPDAQKKVCMTPGVAVKPVIYLYPTEPQDIKVRLDHNGPLTTTYPKYDKAISGWKVKAYPDGKLIDDTDGREYSYIFWEGDQDTSKYDLTKGFVVKGSDTQSFLQSSLSRLGLTPKEYNEMIVYWLPKMQDNKYNLIHFADSEYTKNAKLTITPSPDSVLRVFMVTKPLDKYQKVERQELPVFDRKGFSVIEWGGTQLLQ